MDFGSILASFWTPRGEAGEGGRLGKAEGWRRREVGEGGRLGKGGHFFPSNSWDELLADCFSN